MSKSSLPLFKSSNLSMAFYDPDTSELEITFNHGKTYRYSGVDPRTAERLKNSRSPGSYLHQHITGRHDCVACDDKDSN